MSEDEIPEASTNPEPKQKLEPKSKPFKVEVLEKISTLMAAAFGFVAAFAWNEAFKHLLLPDPGTIHHPTVLLGYALGVTILAVILTIVIARATGELKKLYNNFLDRKNELYCAGLHPVQ